MSILEAYTKSFDKSSEIKFNDQVFHLLFNLCLQSVHFWMVVFVISIWYFNQLFVSLQRFWIFACRMP